MLNVSHSAISQQIKALEAHLGVALLDRSGRKARLNSAGARLAGVLDDGFGRIGDCIAELTQAERARPLHVSTTPAFAANWLMPRLEDFRRAHPGYDIMIDPNPALIDPTRGGIDVAIRYGNGRWPGLDARMLLRSGMAVVAAPSLIREAVIRSPSDLTHLPWLQEMGTSEATQWLERHGSSGPEGRGTLFLPGNLALDAARQGQGILVTASVWVQDDVRDGRLRLLFEDGFEDGYFIVTRPGHTRPAVDNFLRWLRRLVSAPTKS